MRRECEKNDKTADHEKGNEKGKAMARERRLWREKEEKGGTWEKEGEEERHSLRKKLAVKSKKEWDEREGRRVEGREGVW